MPLSIFVHDSAIVDAGADIGAGSKVWHFAHISRGCEIGMHCTLGQGVYIAPGVRLGDGVTISNNVSLYAGLQLGDNVFVGPGAVFTNVEVPRAQPGRREATAQIQVGQGCTIGANATLLAGVQVGAWSFVAAGSVVTHDVPDYALVLGVPAKASGWVCQCGHRLDEDLHCSSCERRYQKSQDALSLAI